MTPGCPRGEALRNAVMWCAAAGGGSARDVLAARRIRVIDDARSLSHPRCTTATAAAATPRSADPVDTAVGDQVAGRAGRRGHHGRLRLHDVVRAACASASARSPLAARGASLSARARGEEREEGRGEQRDGTG